MFIAAVPIYANSLLIENNEIYIYDTSDLSYERVSCDEVKNSVEYRNYDTYIGKNLLAGFNYEENSYIYNHGALEYVIKARMSHIDRVRVSLGKVKYSRKCWHFGSYGFKFETPFFSGDKLTLYVNDTRVAEVQHCSVTVHYTFFFNEYLIVRLLQTFDKKRFYSVALKRNNDIAAVWNNESGCIYGDERLVSQVELLCGIK